MRGLIIDVGANEGLFALQQAQENPSHLVVAIEPIPELAIEIERKGKARNLQNLLVLQVAIDSTRGTKTLHVSDAFSKGTSSLLNFVAYEKLNAYWGTRPDSLSNKSISVNCLTLEELLLNLVDSYEAYEIQHLPIDFIKIDVQGKDIEALLSAGIFIKKIRAGMIEAPVQIEDSIYEGDQKSLAKCVEILNQLDFKIYQLKPNDPEMVEYNIYFSQSNFDIEAHVSKLRLKNNDIYFGNVNPAIDIENLIKSYQNSLSMKITIPIRAVRKIVNKILFS